MQVTVCDICGTRIFGSSAAVMIGFIEADKSTNIQEDYCPVCYKKLINLISIMKIKGRDSVGELRR